MTARREVNTCPEDLLAMFPAKYREYNLLAGAALLLAVHNRHICRKVRTNGKTKKKEKL